MSGLWPFLVLKTAFMVLMIAFAARELWLLRTAKDDPEVTRRLLRVLGGAEGRKRAGPKAPPSPLEEEEPEPLRRAA